MIGLIRVCTSYVDLVKDFFLLATLIVVVGGLQFLKRKQNFSSQVCNIWFKTFSTSLLHISSIPFSRLFYYFWPQYLSQCTLEDSDWQFTIQNWYLVQEFTDPDFIGSCSPSLPLCFHHFIHSSFTCNSFMLKSNQDLRMQTEL